MKDLATDLDYPEPTKAKPLNYLVQSQGVPEPAGYYDKQPLVISHYPCMDGFTAAWAMWLKYPNAEFVPGVYGQAPPDCKDRDVFILDFSYKRNILERIALEAKRLVVLDHHKSAMADLDGFAELFTPDQLVDVTILFDMNKSGARLSWEWFHPHTEVPLFVRLVEDRDLWRFALPDSKALNAAFFSYDYEFAMWSNLRVACEAPLLYTALRDAGAAIEHKHMKDVLELVGKTRRTLEFGACVPPWQVPCANLPYTMSSDAAGLMAEDEPFAATYYQDAEGQYVFSLRSTEKGVDVSIIAASYGGGGHKNAAGFRVASLEDL